MSLDCFVHLLKVVRIFRVGKVHTHDVLTVHQDRGSDGTFVDVLSVDDSFPPPFVQHNSDCVFVVVFSSSHEDVFMMCAHMWIKKMHSLTHKEDAHEED